MTSVPTRPSAHPELLRHICPICNQPFFQHAPTCGLKSPYGPPGKEPTWTMSSSPLTSV